MGHYGNYQGITNKGCGGTPRCFFRFQWNAEQQKTEENSDGKAKFWWDTREKRTRKRWDYMNKREEKNNTNTWLCVPAWWMVSDKHGWIYVKVGKTKKKLLLWTRELNPYFYFGTAVNCFSRSSRDIGRTDDGIRSPDPVNWDPWTPTDASSFSSGVWIGPTCDSSDGTTGWCCCWLWLGPCLSCMLAIWACCCCIWAIFAINMCCCWARDIIILRCCIWACWCWAISIWTFGGSCCCGCCCCPLTTPFPRAHPTPEFIACTILA